MSICNAENESGLQILIPNAAGLQIWQSSPYLSAHKNSPSQCLSVPFYAQRTVSPCCPWQIKMPRKRCFVGKKTDFFWRFFSCRALLDSSDQVVKKESPCFSGAVANSSLFTLHFSKISVKRFCRLLTISYLCTVKTFICQQYQIFIF